MLHYSEATSKKGPTPMHIGYAGKGKGKQDKGEGSRKGKQTQKGYGKTVRYIKSQENNADKYSQNSKGKDPRKNE